MFNLCYQSLAKTVLLAFGTLVITFNSAMASTQPEAELLVTTTNPSPNINSNKTSGDLFSLETAENSFTILNSLLKTSGLIYSLQQGGSYTIFAPTDQAFAALPAKTLEDLQRPQNQQVLIQILRYHIVPEQLVANQLHSGELKTLEGRSVNIQINTTAKKISVNNAQITQSNIQANNGVIHAISQVLIPSNVSLQGQPQAQTNNINLGRSNRGGRSYVGVGGNIGLGGDTALGDGSFTVISKLGLTNTLSIRPTAVIGGDTVILVPLTFDFIPQSTKVLGENFSVSPYIGVGIAIETSDNADVGLSLTGGMEVPLGEQFTLNGAVNAAFLNDTDVGLLFGIGYNF
jgi:uncharacterized surface protein with fasciclin (FAS1) repeats